MERIPVYVRAEDPISKAGVESQLRPRPEVLVLSDQEVDLARVSVVIADRVSDQTLRTMRGIRSSGGARVVLVARGFDDADLASAIEVGVAGMVRRGEASAERLVSVISAAAAGEGVVPPDLLGRLLEQVGQLQRDVLSPRGLTFTGLAEREVAVLRLVADGLDTAEIATRLAYSQRTVKNVLHDITSRLHLKNRSHAVAYALRNGLI